MPNFLRGKLRQKSGAAEFLEVKVDPLGFFSLTEIFCLAEKEHL